MGTLVAAMVKVHGVSAVEIGLVGDIGRLRVI